MSSINWIRAAAAFAVGAMAQSGTSATDTVKPQQQVAESIARHETPSEPSVGTVAALVVPGIVRAELGFEPFSEQDRSLLREFSSSLRSVERAAAEPVLKELCALPEDDSLRRSRLFGEVWQAQRDAVTRAAESLMERLSPEGADSLGALFRERMGGITSKVVDWEGLAMDSPDEVAWTIKGACRQYQIVLNYERANAAETTLNSRGEESQ